MVVIRVEKNNNYTVMSNYHLRERGMSWKAKGLMSYLLSLPDDWEISIENLSYNARDGIDSVRSALDELVVFGYLERPGRSRDERGRLRESIYTLHEKPILKTEKPIENETDDEGESTVQTPSPILENPTLDTDVEVAESLENTENEYASPILENPILENPTQDGKIQIKPPDGLAQKSDLGKPTLENPILEKSVQENPRQLNTNILNTNNINTNILNQGAREAPPEQHNKNRMYFPDDKELNDAFRDFIFMRRRKAGNILSDRVIAKTKVWLREAATVGGVYDRLRTIDILDYSTRNGMSKLIMPEERFEWRAPKDQGMDLKSPSYEGKSDSELEEALIAN
jgi:hypothetical protein